MTKKMLIDAAHPEEVRVAVLDQNRVEDFDFESAARKPLRGNIYLARVTRVEPSLQAAFVEYGGNRHGFLAFSEIHPDYYQIPVADRERLQAAEAEVADLAAQLELVQRGDEDDDDAPLDDSDELNAISDNSDDEEESDESVAGETDADDEEAVDEPEDAGDAERPAPAPLKTAPSSSIKTEEEEEEEEVRPKHEREGDTDKVDNDEAAQTPELDLAEPETAERETDKDAQSGNIDGSSDDAAEPQADAAEAEQPVIQSEDEEALDEAEAGDEEAIAAPQDDERDGENDARDDEDEGGGSDSRKARNALFERYKEAKRKRSQLLRNYKIQEVIKRRQILLIQVVKEERGNKGAALTTYMSLAGRYCVLMPNTARGGGISRKIPNGSDRRRLRRVVDSLEVPQGMGLIIRTAGAKRTKTEIKRDYEYLLRLWENIRTLTLKSIAPCLIYEEASLIKRAIRDLYDKDISKVMVEGETGYREAKDFMKMLMPSHAKYVQPYKERAPIFLKHNVETQLDGMYQPSVRLKSGGYIVIHQTEALVAIDVNSGRATRERNIELTALKTNVEAAQEAARQFRLRDLAGLIVIDFIDMEEPKNNRKVEKALKEALKSDRARIQTGRISNFGLLEMSRQRRRSGIVDGTTHTCPTCAGAGVVRSQEMASLRILRAIEGEAISGKVGQISARASIDVSLYLLNNHRDWLKRIEIDNGVSIEIIADTEKAGDAYDLEKSGAPRPRDEAQVVRADQTETIEIDDDEIRKEPVIAEEDIKDKEDKEGGRNKRRRRRKRKKDAVEQAATEADGDSVNAGADQINEEQPASSEGEEDGEDKPKRRRRRGRRGGRRNRQSSETQDAAASAPQSEGDSEQPAIEIPAAVDHDAVENKAVDNKALDNKAGNNEAPKSAEPAEPAGDLMEAGRSHDAASVQATQDEAAPQQADLPQAESKPKKPARKGWWSRATGS